MSFTAALLSPLTLLVSMAGGQDQQGHARAQRMEAVGADFAVPPFWGVDEARWSRGLRNSVQPSTQPESAWQVRIERRMTIRVAPRAAMPSRGDMFSAHPERLTGPRFSERKIGKCIPAAAVVGVEPNGPHHLILFLRDRRMINAELEHSCVASSFYSGFYLSRSADGELCVDRDTLQSRSGSACKLSRIRQLVETGD